MTPAGRAVASGEKGRLLRWKVMPIEGTSKEVTGPGAAQQNGPVDQKVQMYGSSP